MLVDFNHPQSLIIIFVDKRLNAAGFACTTVTKKQHVICRAACYKSLRIFQQALLLVLITDEISKDNLLRIGYWHQLWRALLRLRYAEGLVQTKLAHAVIMIEFGNAGEKLISISSTFQSSAECLHLIADIFV